jgi:hypothetical protein
VLIAVIETQAPWLQKTIFAIANALPGANHRAAVGKAELASVMFWVPALLLATAVHFAVEKPATRLMRATLAAFDQFRRPAARDAVAP